MSHLFISSAERQKWENRKRDWGEQGPAHNVGYRIDNATRFLVETNHTGFVPRNSMEQQKSRELLSQFYFFNILVNTNLGISNEVPDATDKYLVLNPTTGRLQITSTYVGSTPLNRLINGRIST